ncbi:hypothetical protein AOZ06_12895 [Kibdelosporangium phytohabitans]|uniref:HTH cro/C1-type domain-containing protein n=2 Tax=Kibdelosporangium phytohabitans TaxID=860235 RepID=A0A0N9HM64_9PSEU|nr:hypothetical protein AOZ06_12575 [Kibdelosporangium phytohabitans]ALG07685.1 hypothetical protein AOZ06_12895 [Kibdelosporangium phytohabitans]
MRERAELTASELAARSGVSLPYLSQLESGKRTNPRMPIRRALAQALGVTAADLPTSDTTTDEQ